MKAVGSQADFLAAGDQFKSVPLDRLIVTTRLACLSLSATRTTPIECICSPDETDFNLASIGDDFDLPYKGPLDKEYMQML